MAKARPKTATKTPASKQPGGLSSKATRTDGTAPFPGDGQLPAAKSAEPLCGALPARQPDRVDNDARRAAERFSALAIDFRNATPGIEWKSLAGSLMNAGDELVAVLRRGLLPAGKWLEWYEREGSQGSGMPLPASGATFLEPQCRLFHLYAESNLTEVGLKPGELTAFDNRGLGDSQTDVLLMRHCNRLARCCEAIANRIDAAIVSEPVDYSGSVDAKRCDVILRMPFEWHNIPGMERRRSKAGAFLWVWPIRPLIPLGKGGHGNSPAWLEPHTDGRFHPWSLRTERLDPATRQMRHHQEWFLPTDDQRLALRRHLPEIDMGNPDWTCVAARLTRPDRALDRNVTVPEIIALLDADATERWRGRADEKAGAGGSPGDETPATKLPPLKPWAMEAWRARQAGMTVTKIAETLAEKYDDPKITQPRVSEQIKHAKANAEASGLASIADRTIPNVGNRAPARTLDPAVTEQGKRTDGKAHYLRDRERQKAQESDDED